MTNVHGGTQQIGGGSGSSSGNFAILPMPCGIAVPQAAPADPIPDERIYLFNRGQYSRLAALTAIWEHNLLTGQAPSAEECAEGYNEEE